MNDSSGPIISVQNLKTYFHQDEGTVKAVDGASFDIYRSKTLGIVGESGCGKSVTARSILRIVDRPGCIEAGEIWLERNIGNGHAEWHGQTERLDLATLGENSQAMRAIRGNEIALIFQEPMTSFSAFHTIGNQIIEAIRLHKPISKRQAKAEAVEILRLVGVPRPERRINEYSFQLSGGLRQRMMIAMALSSDPSVVIADEPTTALDVTTQTQVLDLLRELQQRRGMAIMLITHDMGVIAEMADDVVVMYLGRVVEKGPVDDIFHQAQHPYTQALLRSIPSIMSPPRTKLATISGSIPHPYNRPSGCPFHPRCPNFIETVCDVHEPQLLPVNDRQEVSCFLYHEPAAS